MKVSPSSIGLTRKCQWFLLTFVFLSLGLSATIRAELKFNSEKIRNVFDMLPYQYKNLLIEKSTSGEETLLLNVRIMDERRKLIVRFNQYNEIEHLGYFLVNNNPEIFKIREVFDYLEREFLRSDLMNEKWLMAEEIKNKNIEILYNGNAITNQCAISVAPKFFIDEQTPIRIKYDCNTFVVEWSIDSTNSVMIKIPNNYSLITEKTKDELERDLLRKLQNSTERKTRRECPSKDRLRLSQSNLYLLPGEIYEMTPELTSNKYFNVGDSIYPVFNNTFYKESISNLLQNLIPSSLKMNIQFKLYGGIDENIKLNLNAFLNNFASDYTLYFGWQNDDKDNLKASMFICNKTYNYHHLMVLSSKSINIFANNGEIDGMLFAYIPPESMN